MRRGIATVCILIVLSLRGFGAEPDRDLESIRTLYQSADYIAALQQLDAYDRSTRTPEQKQASRWYRALCFIALERTDDAQRMLQEFVKADPLSTPGGDLPPRVSAMLLAVRRQIAPDLARDAFAQARTLVSSGQTTEAQALLKKVVALVDDPSLQLSADPAFASLRSEAKNIQIVASGLTPSAQKSPFPFPPAAPYVPAQALWQPFPQLISGVYSSGGELAIEVGANGLVRSARMTVSISPAYDELLVQTALKEWIFIPAVRDGAAVSSTLRIPVTISVR